MSDLGVEKREAASHVRVWDVPTRLFHWLLVALLISAYCTRNYLDDPTLYWHRMNGYAVLTLILFRILWGLVGSSTSRFASFFPTPRNVIGYVAALLRARPLHYLGHNPLGSLLIFAMLLAVAAQAGTGLFATDDTIAQGPLHDHAPNWVTSRAGSYHARGFWIIAGLAAMHVLANLIYQFGLKDRLITAMISGNKPDGPCIGPEAPRFQSGLRAAVCLLAAMAVVGGGVLATGDSLIR